jgi:two-component system chemotaxis response regulator CheB
VAERIVVIGASAGGVEALMKVAAALPRDFAAPVVIVLHIGAEGPSVLPQILERSGPLPVREASDGELLRPGTIYTAIPDHHVFVDEDKTLRLVKGPRENRHRPAIDPLFRSAALAFRSRCIGVILTGTLDDGTAGMLAVKKGGGVTIVQDPAEAMYPSMPQNVLDFVKVDYVLPLAGIAAKLAECVRAPCATAERRANLEMLEMEKKIVALDPKTLQDDDRPGTPSAYSCPDCGGVLWEIEDGEDYIRYRCRVGHAFSPETMLDAQNDVLEEALWSAMKTLEESARLSARLAANERRRGHDWLVKRFEEKERDARTRAEVIRKFLTSEEPQQARK